MGKKVQEQKVRGSRQFTRKQRIEILTLLANAAGQVIGQDSQEEAGALRVLRLGAIALVSSNKADVEPVIQAVRAGGDVAGAISAFELAGFPQPVPANKKPEGEPKPAPPAKAKPAAKAKAQKPAVAKVEAPAQEPEPAAV